MMIFDQRQSTKERSSINWLKLLQPKNGVPFGGGGVTLRPPPSSKEILVVGPGFTPYLQLCYSRLMHFVDAVGMLKMKQFQN